MNEKLVEMLVNMLIDSMEDGIDEETLDEQINDFRNLAKFKNQDENFFARVKAEFSSRIAIRLDHGVLLEEKNHKKWFKNRKTTLDMKYWLRYENYLMKTKGFSPNVVNTMDDILDELTDLLGDPQLVTGFSRKGLVIGDVQSGKTANYTGLICKAADAGYKVIILLTGTIEKLRRQTQIRLDEGFVGFDSHAMQQGKQDISVGVSKYDGSVKAISLTSSTDDFKLKTAGNMIFDLESVNAPVLFVIKKNVTTLKRLHKWLSTFNRQGKEKIRHPLLIVDDESDNASVNTSSDDSNPTKTNRHIRDLIELFEKSSYIGYTATPFANIFIDPLTNEDMMTEDLFPKDYIYSLDSPSNYIGARNIFGEFADKEKIVRELTLEEEIELSEIIPMNHKKELIVDILPEAMIEAIQVFLLTNVIRDLREHDGTHRSMLINVSRFTDVQERLSFIVKGKLKNIQSAARVFSGLPEKEARKNSEIAKLENIYRKKLSGSEFYWHEILKGLYKGIGSVEVVVINLKSKDNLDYESYPDGRRIIAVGGLSLSRGLTLEGLMTSFIYRNTRMYDTMLQMGRWFGYRNQYDDLCKIYLTSESRDWYRQISEATDELREDIKKKHSTGLTPLEFGIRVRSDKNSLLVTARNKMRTSEKRTMSISLSETTVESTDIFVSMEKNDMNRRVIDSLKDELNEDGHELMKYANSYAYKNIPKIKITEFMDQFLLPGTNEYLDTNVLSKFIEGYNGRELDYWDVGFVNGSHTGSEYHLKESKIINASLRGFTAHGNSFDIVRMSGSKRRLGNVSDGNIGLGMVSETIVHRKYQIKKKFGNVFNKKKSLSQKDYFIHDYIEKKRNPLLLVYFVNLKFNPNLISTVKYSADQIEVIRRFENRNVYGIGLGIPKLTDTKTEHATYVVNRIYKDLEDEYDFGDEDE